MKSCTKKSCIQVNPQPLENFGRRIRYRDGINTQCKACMNQKAQEWRDKNPEKLTKYNKDAYWRRPEKQKRKARAGRFKTKYWPHLTLKEAAAEWDKMYAEQEGKCAICLRLKLLEVEHCHKTGKIRSLACNGCNTALARIDENIEIAKALINYIETHNKC